MNPFDLPGPEFLRFFCVFAMVITAGAIVLNRLLRWRLVRKTESGATTGVADLDGYEIASLAGGDGLTVRATVAAMTHRGTLVFVPSKGLRTNENSFHTLSSDLERSIHASLRAEPWQTVGKLCRQPRIAAHCEAIRNRLQHLGLKPPGKEVARISWIPLWAVLGVTTLGLVRVVSGATQGRPIAYLVLACVVYLLLAMPFVWPLSRDPVSFTTRTRAGDRLLETVRQRHKALEHIATRAPLAVTSSDLTLAVGLFGTGVLAGTAFEQVRSSTRTLTEPICGFWSPGGLGGCGGGGGGCGGCGGG